MSSDTQLRDRLIATDSESRKTFPMASGLLDYFPDALAAVAQHSYLANQKHNPGEPMHHARGKSMDHADCILRHLVRRGGFDGPYRESTALAWRALALLQEELEREFNLPLPRAARAPEAAAQEQDGLHLIKGGQPHPTMPGSILPRDSVTEPKR